MREKQRTSWLQMFSKFLCKEEGRKKRSKSRNKSPLLHYGTDFVAVGIELIFNIE